MITIPTSNRAEKPKGAPFYVDRVSFRPGERVDVARFTLADDKVFDWPMVYILANKDTAYVGQTTSIATRMNQHGANEENATSTRSTLSTTRNSTARSSLTMSTVLSAICMRTAGTSSPTKTRA